MVQQEVQAGAEAVEKGNEEVVGAETVEKGNEEVAVAEQEVAGDKQEVAGDEEKLPVDEEKVAGDKEEVTGDEEIVDGVKGEEKPVDEAAGEDKADEAEKADKASAEEADKASAEEAAPAEGAAPAEKTEKAEAAPAEGAEAQESEKTDPVSELFPDSTELKLQPSETEQIAELQAQLSTLKQANTKLKAENSQLKLLKLEHLDKIETLELANQDLTQKLAKLQVDAHQQHGYDDNSPLLSPSPEPFEAHQAQQPPFTSFKPLLKNESSLSLNEIKIKLSKWKNWNVDMTHWRSIGTGPVVEL